jgi:hypothetical protein
MEVGTMQIILAVAAFGAALLPLYPAGDDMPVILPLRERAEVVNNWLATRLDSVVPLLMRREGIDMWVVVAREYNEDPVVLTMLPASWQAARRRTILVFFDQGEENGVERLAMARYDIGDLYKGIWKKEEEPDQWKCLAKGIAERNPKRIAVNVSPEFALADGLTHAEYESLAACLPVGYKERLVSGERLAVGWLETRIPEEMVVYPAICRIAHRIIAEGLSEQVIQPGVTTTDDVQWWYQERIQELKLDTWFSPSVSIQRAGGPQEWDPSTRMRSAVILPGDLLHIDLGITYLRLNTDCQEHAYVLQAGETDAPEGLKKALAVGNRLQDILNENIKTGRTGNEVLAASLEQAKSEGIRPSIYTHPLGFHGHAAGPTIGLWDQQEGVPGQGDYPVFSNTAYSSELNVTVAVPEWEGKEIRIMLEEDVFFDGETVRFIDGRQTKLILLPGSSGVGHLGK